MGKENCEIVKFCMVLLHFFVAIKFDPQVYLYQKKKCLERLAPWKDFIISRDVLCDHTINKLVQISI